MKLKRSKKKQPTYPYTVFILGAGFSKDAGGLLIKDLLAQKADIPEDYQYIWDLYERAKKRGIVTDVESFMDYLSGLSFLELGWKIKRLKKRKSFVMASKIYSDTIIAVLNILERAIDKVSSAGLPNFYSLFADKFLRLLNGGSHPTNSIVTFNWDVVCEQMLLDGFKHLKYPSDQIKPYEDYVGFRKGINVFKLHGSSNWLYCEKCNTIYAFEQSLAHDPTKIASYRCPKPGCRKALARTIVPPTWEKTTYVNQLKALWKLAWNELREKAHQVIVLGYSFSDRDLLARYLIFTALAGNQNLKRVILVNGNSDDGESFLRGFLGDKVKNMRATFADFVSSYDIKNLP